MKVLSLFSVLFLALTINLLSMSQSGGSSSGSGTCCEAKSTLGGSCSVSNCFDCECSGGLLSADCKCLDSSPPSTLRGLPSVSSPVRNDILDFISYCSTYGTSGMTTLSVKIQDVLDAVDNSNQTDYTTAEENYVNTFLTLTTNEVNDIRTWVVNKGYPTF